MRTIRSFVLFGAGIILSFNLIHAQQASFYSANASFESATDVSAMLEALETVPPVPFDATSAQSISGTFWSAQHVLGSQSQWPPLPGNILQLDFWPLGDSVYILDDRQVDYDELAAEENSKTSQLIANNVFFPLGFSTFAYSTNDLWLELVSVDLTNQLANVLAHNTSDTTFYQLLSKTNLLQPDWTLGEWRFYGDSGTNTTMFSPVNLDGNPTMFFRAQQSDWIVYIGGGVPAIESQGSFPGQTGKFSFVGTWASGATNDLTVYYSVSGTASNGMDYTYLSGVAVLTNNIGYTEINVQPIADNLVEGDEIVTLTLVPTNTYLSLAGTISATIHIFDSSTTVSMGVSTSDAIEPDGPPGAAAQIGSFWCSRSDSRGLYPDLDVFYRIGGTASNGVDYSLFSGVIHFVDGIDSTNLNLNPLADSVIEGLETVTLNLIPTNTYLVNADINATTGTVTIIDSTTVVNITGDSTIGIEPDGPPGTPSVPVIFTVYRYDTRGVYTNIPVRYVVGGTASNGVDYVLLSGTLNFAPGITDTNLAITPLTDNVIEGLETVTLTLLETNGYFIDTNNAAATNQINDSTTTLRISAGIGEVEPGHDTNSPGQVGFFTILRTDTRNIYPVQTAKYLISGTASNGLDYSNLTGTVTFAATATSTNIFVQPLADSLLEGDETVILTLVATNGYFVYTNAYTATNVIVDTLNFEIAVTSLYPPAGIDCHAPSNSLILGFDANDGAPYNFARIYTNLVMSNSVVVTNLVVTNWSGVHGLGDERKLATVKTNASGFTNGEVYFGSGTSIGWVSADGTRSNLNWCVLTNAIVTNSLPIRGSLYVDQTGVFSNQLIAVTGDGSLTIANRGVWRVDAQAHPTLLANILTAHLEGVITLPNDSNKWGPWAGKIITGDEIKTPPLIYTIDTNGSVTTVDTTTLIPGGIRTEDFDIIPPNQNLYICDLTGPKLLKLPANYFTNYIGDLLITEAGENFNSPAKLFIVHWDAATTNFVTRKITYNNSFEHVTFAPIGIPSR